MRRLDHWPPMSPSRRTGAVPDPEWPTLRERFRSKVDLDGPIHPHLNTACHVWTAYKDTTGYGRFSIGGRSMMAHRIAWVLANGPDSLSHDPADPNGYIEVCHACDNRACVRPDHLYLAPHRGEGHRGALLSESQMIAIREATGRTYDELAAEYGVSRAAIGVIKRGDSWSHFGGPRDNPGRSHGRGGPPRVVRLSPQETREAVLRLMPPEDRGGTSTRGPWSVSLAAGAVSRLAARLGVTSKMVQLVCREGITPDMLERWREALT